MTEQTETKKKSKNKAKLYLYLGFKEQNIDETNLQWFLVNDSDIMLMGEGLNEQVEQLAKEYKCFAILSAKIANLLSVEAPMGIKKSDYSMLLEDGIMQDIETSFISLADKQKSATGGQILDFALVDKAEVLAWQDLLNAKQIFVEKYFLDALFFKPALEQNLLPHASKVVQLAYDENSDFVLYKNSKGKLAWLNWNKALGALPPEIENLVGKQENKIIFKTAYEVLNQIVQNSYACANLDIPRTKRQGVFTNLSNLEFLAKFAILRKFIPGANIIKKPVFWFVVVALTLFGSERVMQSNLTAQKLETQYAQVQALKFGQNMSTAELVLRIEKGMQNYPKAQARIKRINSIIGKVNLRLNESIILEQINWNEKKLILVLSFADENSLENILKIADSNKVEGDKVNLEFNL